MGERKRETSGDWKFGRVDHERWTNRFDHRTVTTYADADDQLLNKELDIGDKSKEFSREST